MDNKPDPGSRSRWSTTVGTSLALVVATTLAVLGGGTVNLSDGAVLSEQSNQSRANTAQSQPGTAAQPRTEAQPQPEGPARNPDRNPDRSNVLQLAAEPITAVVGAPRRELVISGVGDFNVDPAYIPALTTFGYEHALSGMDGLFLEDHLTVINLECPASDLGGPEPKQFTFRCDTAALPIIKEMGVDVASQGNNHSLDFGVEALLDSLANLRAVGIAPVGAGVNATEANRPAILDRRGWTIAIVGFGGVVPGPGWLATDNAPGMADGDTVASMVAAVEAADSVADLVVVTIHWGVELQTGPPAEDVVRARAMIDAGADIIFGHHAHRLNALEWYEGRPIFWGLGNFVWPRLSAAGSDTAVGQVRVGADGSIDACLIDVTIVSDGHPELDDPSFRSCPGQSG